MQDTKILLPHYLMSAVRNFHKKTRLSVNKNDEQAIVIDVFIRDSGRLCVRLAVSLLWFCVCLFWNLLERE